MRKQTIQIEDIGQAVNHIVAGFSFLNGEKKLKYLLRLALVTFVTGTAIGIRSCSLKETVNVKELLPTGSIDHTFSLMAQPKQTEIFRIDQDGNMYGWGNWIGKNDKSIILYKIEGKEEIVVVDIKRNKIHLMDTPESIRK